MPQSLPKQNSDGRDWIQFRGPQTSVTHDPTGIRFGTEHRGRHRIQSPHPVVDPDDAADPGVDTPADAVARPVAEQLVESNPLVCWGVACPVCGDVFDSPNGVTSHLSVHSDTDADADADAADSEDDSDAAADDPDGSDTDETGGDGVAGD